MENIEEMLKLQENFLHRWTLNNVKDMTLEEYTSIGNTDTFTYWLESKTTDVISIWGGSSYKFGIFKRNTESEQKDLRDRQSTDGEYGWYTKYGKTKEEAFINVKDNIINIIHYAQSKEFKKIDDVDLGNAVKWKISFLYAPQNSLLRIVKDKALYYLAKKHLNIKSKSISDIQKQLIDNKPNDIDLNTYSIQLWNEYTNEESKIRKKYWLYAPGQNASKWNEFYNESIMALGWDSLGDLNSYKQKEDIVKKLQVLENTTSSKKNDATANFDFFNNINIGDIVIAKKGRTEYLGYGIVDSDYFYSENRSEYKHCRKINWVKKGVWEEPKKDIVLKTLTDITKYDDYVEKLINLIGIKMTKKNCKEIEEQYKTIDYSLNTILYGPPGTGKTYNTINETLKIIDNEFYLENIDNRSELIKKFNDYKLKGQIEFVTFHQSYGYEEFVEGIKAIPPGRTGNEDGEEMIYDVVPGIFKTISNDAKKSNFTNETTINKYYLTAPTLNIQAEMIKDDDNSFRVLKGSKIRKDQSNTFRLNSFKEKILSSTAHVEEDEWYILNEDYTFKSMSGSASIILGRQANGFKEWKESVNDNLFNILDESNSIRKNYVLIIDEINRGNISKIFGELITLIEDSKRLGAEESIEITLPYSGERFSVPQNLYIVGTMNTADRSIALMDTALRRRFDFKEMMPQVDLLMQTRVNEINIGKLLTTINKRVNYLYDRDHTIGHAYFISLNNLNNKDAKITLDGIFKNKIIPLLQEYFYDDWEKIQIVLGDHPKQGSKNEDKFIIEELQEETSILGFDHDDIENDQYKYTINTDFTIDAYKKLVE